jgi:hypothetical protein
MTRPTEARPVAMPLSKTELAISELGELFVGVAAATDALRRKGFVNLAALVDRRRALMSSTPAKLLPERRHVNTGVVFNSDIDRRLEGSDAA